MAATFTEVTLEDMEKFLKRGFRALRPKQNLTRGEYSYDLSLSDDVIIRVWTSITRSGVGADVGSDAIRIQLIGVKSNRPLMAGKAPIVKRTQNWRGSLQDRIEDAIEVYEEKTEYWDGRGKGETAPSSGSGAPPPGEAQATGGGPSDKQVKFVMDMAGRANEGQWKRIEDKYKLAWPLTEEALRKLPGRQVSLLIGDLLAMNLGRQNPYSRRYASELDGVDYSYDRNS